MERETFLTLFKSLARSHLEDTTTIWPPTYKKDTIQIETVQRRATRLERADIIQVDNILHDLIR